MDTQIARQTLDQLYEYTKSVYRFLGIDFEQGGRNNYGLFEAGKPIGAITHYTASNAAYGPRRPYGRIPVLLNRFARGGKQGVGVQFIIWDELVERFEEFRCRYPLLKDMPGEVFFMGDALVFWHAGSANRWAYGIEVRNAGKLTKSSQGVWYWGGSRHKYIGRKPIKVGNSWWEPYTLSQMRACLWIHRLMAILHPIRPERFLGHVHVTNTRTDPGPHFPIHEMRKYTLDPILKTVPLDDIEFLREFKQDSELVLRQEVAASEEALHQGMYRHDWDGNPDDWDGDPRHLDGAIELGDKATRDNYGQQLQSVGYHYDPDDEVALGDTVAIFRSRWKRRVNKRWRSILKANGGMSDAAQIYLTQLVRQYERR